MSPPFTHYKGEDEAAMEDERGEQALRKRKDNSTMKEFSGSETIKVRKES